MKERHRFIKFAIFGLVCVPLACNKQAGTSKAQPNDAAKTSETSKPHSDRHGTTTDSSSSAGQHGGEASTPHDAPHTASQNGPGLTLDGLTLTVPDGWQRGTIAPGPFAPVAVFDLPKTGDDAEGGQVRITHYPGMKGKDDLNIQRWLGQITKDDGSSYSLDEANLTVRENGNVRIKTIDLKGNVKATMRATPQPGNRMIAAIIDHPKGPHFVVTTGGVATIKKWETTIRLFLDSATVTPQ